MTRDGRGPVLLDVVEYRDDVRMVQSGENPRFGREPTANLRISAEGLWELLDRYGAIQTAMPSGQHHAEGASAELAIDVVAGECFRDLVAVDAHRRARRIPVSAGSPRRTQQRGMGRILQSSRPVHYCAPTPWCRGQEAPHSGLLVPVKSRDGREPATRSPRPHGGRELRPLAPLPRLTSAFRGEDGGTTWPGIQPRGPRLSVRRTGWRRSADRAPRRRERRPARRSVAP